MITAFKPRQPKYNVYFMSRFSLAFSDAPIFIDKKRVGSAIFREFRE